MIIINDNQLKEEEVEVIKNKVRAVLIDEEGKMPIAVYNDAILFPGGKIDKGEIKEEAIVRELKEELGASYLIDELTEVLTMVEYQKDYPTVKGEIVNRKIATTYYLGKFKGLNLDEVEITEEEKKGNFKIDIIDIEKFKEVIDGISKDNPRNEYFKKELEIVHDLLVSKGILK